jgi:hypothetical protein
MQTLIFTLSLTSALLFIGITGTLIGITRLVYPSSRRYSQKRNKDMRSRAGRATRRT